MLKLKRLSLSNGFMFQPPSGGCVLKLITQHPRLIDVHQPPSGGCVLKRLWRIGGAMNWGSQPPSGGCVLKPVRYYPYFHTKCQPPSGGCVLKLG